jgi:molybdenum cofactor guanylyltransferase
MAGGAASRIGGDKQLLQLGGKPMISYPLATLAEAGIEAVVVAKSDSPLPSLDVPVWQEPDKPRHPLCGIVTALERADGRPVIVCGCDMPFLSAGLLSHMAERGEPLVVPRFCGRLHPLIARYEPSLLDELRLAIDPPRALQEVIAELEPETIDERELRRFGDPARVLFNVNTREDLARAEELTRN